MNQASTTIATADGRRVPSPKAQIPQRPPAPPAVSPLVSTLAGVIADSWGHGGSFPDLAALLLDKVAHHIRSSSLAQLDPILADAIEDGMHVDPLEGDHDQARECSVEDIEAHRAREFARVSISAARHSYTADETEGMVGAMLKRPSETNRYLVLRAEGHTPASALAIILHERKEAAARKAHAWNGGAL